MFKVHESEADRRMWRIRDIQSRFGYHPRAASTTAYDTARWTSLVGNAYLNTPCMADMPEVRHIWNTFAAEIEQQFIALLSDGFRFEFTYDDPVNPETGKPDMEYLRNLMVETGVLPVYKGDSEHPILGKPRFWYDGQHISANVMFRAVHDTLAHFAGDFAFNFKDEIGAYQYHAVTLSDTAKIALYCETMGQLTAGRVLGVFPEQKCIILPWREIPACEVIPRTSSY